MKKIVILVVCLSLWVSGCTTEQKNNSKTLRQDQIDLLLNLQKQGLITLEPEFRTVYIETGLWNDMKYQVKEDFAATLAIYCANKKGSTTYWVKILDKYSGKEVGEYGSFGFKVY
jgi:hypothetical protein